MLHWRWVDHTEGNVTIFWQLTEILKLRSMTSLANSDSIHSIVVGLFIVLVKVFGLPIQFVLFD